MTDDDLLEDIQTLRDYVRARSAGARDNWSEVAKLIAGRHPRETDVIESAPGSWADKVRRV